MLKRVLALGCSVCVLLASFISTASEDPWVDISVESDGGDSPPINIEVDSDPDTPAAFADVRVKEALYIGPSETYEGLLSECWNKALAEGSGTITLLTNVTASAYDTEVYTGNQYVDTDGTTRTADSHAITRYAGGLATMSVPDGADITIDLGGFVLDRNMDAADGTADRAYSFEVFSGGTLTLTDSVGSGKITGGYGHSCGVCDHDYGSCAIVHEGGTLNLDSVEISGNTGFGAVVGDGAISLGGSVVIQDNYNDDNIPCNLVVSETSIVTASSLERSALVGLTVDGGDASYAVQYSNGSADNFLSDLGLGTFYADGYVGVGLAEESTYDAEYTNSVGIVFTGSFADMWELLAQNGSGTLKLLRDCDVTGTFEYDMASAPFPAIVDFNGHVLHATGTPYGNLFYIGNNAHSQPVIFTDSSGRAIETSTTVEGVGEPEWDPDTRVYKYYKASIVDGGLDNGLIPVISEVTADFSHLGGIDAEGYSSVIYTANGYVRIDGGAHRNDLGFLHTVWAETRIEMTGGYVFDSDATKRLYSDVQSGGAFCLRAGRLFEMSGGTIAGCSGIYGGAINGSMTSTSITGGVITNNFASTNGGAIDLFNTISTSISNVLICCNESQGVSGGVAFDSGTTDVTCVDFVCNTARTYGGGACTHNAVTITNCQFVGNSARVGGGVCTNSEDTVVAISDSNFYNNFAEVAGGAISNRLGSLQVASTIVEKNASPLGSGAYVATDAFEIKSGFVCDQAYLTFGKSFTLSEAVIGVQLGITVEGTPTVDTPVLIVSNPFNVDTTNLAAGITSLQYYAVVSESSGLFFSDDLVINCEASYTSTDGVLREFGTFDEMWAKLTEVPNGTITLRKNVDLSNKQYLWNKDGNATLDFYGHVITADKSSGGYLFEIKTSDECTFTFTDSAGKVTEARERVTAISDPTWDAANRVYTYYVAEAEQVEETDEFIPVHYKVTVDMTKMGGLDVTGYGRAVVVSSGQFIIGGGAYRSSKGFCYATGEDTTVKINGGYIFDSGDRNISIRNTAIYQYIEGGALYAASATKSVEISNAAIIGCEAKQGGALRLTCRAVTIRDSIFTQCYGGYNGGAAFVDNACTSCELDNVNMCLNSSGERGGAIIFDSNVGVIKNSNFISNSAGQGGAIQTNRTTHTLTISDSTFVGNTAATGGAITCESGQTPNWSFTQSIFEHNTATLRGGALDLISAKCTLNTVTISHNEAPEFTQGVGGGGGGGIYAGTIFYIGNSVVVKDNVNSNIALATGVYGETIDTVTPGYLSFYTEDIPSETHHVTLVKDTVGRNIVALWDYIAIENGDYDIEYDESTYYLQIPWDGIILQSYVNYWRVARKEDADAGLINSAVTMDTLEMISTKGGVLPTNAYTPKDGTNPPPLMHMYVKTNDAPVEMYSGEDPKSDYVNAEGIGSIVKVHKLQEAFTDKYLLLSDFILDECVKLDPNKYAISEVWVAKPNTRKGSINRDEWDIYPYTEFTTDCLTGTEIVRLVYEQVHGDYSVDCMFYDYDITDGGFYNSVSGSWFLGTRYPTSAQYTIGGLHYLATAEYGINTATNYSGLGEKFVFGNANTGVVGCTNVWSSPTGDVAFNKAANNTNGTPTSLRTYAYAAYGLASHLDAEGNIVYSPGLDVPSLFGEKPAVGKTVIPGYQLLFQRYGETYTLTAVSNTNVKNLERFSHPGIYDGVQHKTKIWTNHFWPMDSAETWGVDGHDVVFGSTERSEVGRVWYTADRNDWGILPKSDDGLNHNAYFGLNFSVDFQLPEDYCGPLEFQFFGDDDLWVFLDDKLVCDIGGVHSSAGEYVDLADYVHTGDTEVHTLSVFYTERGASGSTCWMKFTVPNILSNTSSHTFMKLSDEGDPISDAEFTLYSNETCTDVVETQVSSELGEVTFPSLTSTEYWMKETKVGREGDVLPETVWKLEYQDATRSWLMYDVSDSTKAPVTQVINYPESVLEMPATGSTDLLYLLSGGSALLGLSGILVLIARRIKI